MSESQFKIFVGGLSQATTKESLTQYFTLFGQADAYVMMDRASGRSRGFGFVNFQEEEVMKGVLAVSHEVDGQAVTCSAYSEKGKGGGKGDSLGSSATPWGARNDAGDRPSAARDQMKIFVGGLAQHTTKQSLDDYFGQFGGADSYLMMDRESGRSRGFGFVNFRDEAAMQAVLDFATPGGPQHEIDGVPVTVRSYADRGKPAPGPWTPRRVDQRPMQVGSKMMVPPGGGRAAGNLDPSLAGLLQRVQGQMGTGGARGSVAAGFAGAMRGGGGGGGGSAHSEFKLFVGGLAQHTDKQSLNTFFGQFGQVDSIVMMDRATGRSRGFGFVNFQDELAMNAALEAGPYEVDGTTVTVSAYGKGNDGPPHKRQRQMQPPQGAAGSAGDVSAQANNILQTTLGLVAKLQEQIQTGGHGGQQPVFTPEQQAMLAAASGLGGAVPGMMGGMQEAPQPWM